jgi:hypothetical protein
MLERTRADDRKVLGIDERLANRRVALERPDAELAARDRQLERAARRRLEGERDRGGERADLGAGDAVRAGFGGEGLDVGGYLGIDGLYV